MLAKSRPLRNFDTKNEDRFADEWQELENVDVRD
jgi:hypothetical protein